MMKKSNSIFVCNCTWGWGNAIKDKSKCVGIDYTVVILENLLTRIYHHRTYNLVLKKRLTQKVLNGFLFNSWISVNEFTPEAIEKQLRWMNLIPITIYKLSINDSTYMRLLSRMA